MVIKPIKIMLGCIVALILILLIMVYTLLFILDINDFKPQISALVKSKIGRDMALNGQLKLVLFPELALSTGSVILSNPADFQGNFMSVDSINIRLEPLPLLFKKIDADTLHISGLKLNLITNKQGITNWGSGWQSQANDTPTDIGAILPGLTIKGIDINNAHINWHHQQTGRHIEVKNFNLTTSPIGTAMPIVSHFSLTVFDKPNQMASLTGQSTLKFNNMDRLTLTDNTLQATLTGKAIPEKLPGFSLSGKEVLIDKAQQTVKANALELKLADLLITSDMILSWNTHQPTLSGKIHLMPVNPSKLMQQLMLSPPPRRDKNTLQHLEGRFSFHATPHTVEFSPLQMNLDDSAITGSVMIKNDAKPTAKFNLAIDTIDVDRYLPPMNKRAKPTEPATVLANFPVETLRKLHATGTLAINKLRMNGSTVQNSQLTLGE